MDKRAVSPFWWARVNGKKESTGVRWDGGSKAQTQLNLRRAVELRTQFLSGVGLPAKEPAPSSHIITVEKMIEMWLLGFPKGSRRHEDESYRMDHWKRELGTLAYNAVLPSTIKAAAARLVERGLEQSSVNRMLTSLQSCFRDSVMRSLR
jgi:hypothetical protein